MTMFLLNNSPLSLDAPFTHEGVNYPANWLRLASPEERAAIGITEAPEPAWYDERFYWGVGNPRDHQGLVTQWVEQTRATANNLLQPTDWQVIRAADSGEAMPQTVKEWREQIRQVSSMKVALIEATTTTDELVAVVTDESYGQWPQVTSPSASGTAGQTDQVPQ